MSSDRPTQHSTLNRLYVEGADDFHVVCALVRKSGVVWTKSDPAIPHAPATNGDANALKQAVVAVKSLTPRVGLVIDADEAPLRRWQQIRQSFGSVGATLPGVYAADGVIVDVAEQCRVGIWMMPYGGQPGAVEKFVSSLLPDSPLRQHANEATAKARELGAAFVERDSEKARLRTWLAWQKAPGAPYGRAIDEGFLGSSSVEATALVEWFRALFKA